MEESSSCSARKFGRGLEIRIAFHVNHQSAQGAGELAFGRAGLGGSAGLHGIGAGVGDGFERFALMAHVAFHGFDEIGDQVVAALELHIDLRPGVVHVVAQPHQAVVDRDEPEERAGENIRAKSRRES